MVFKKVQGNFLGLVSMSYGAGSQKIEPRWHLVRHLAV